MIEMDYESENVSEDEYEIPDLQVRYDSCSETEDENSMDESYLLQKNLIKKQKEQHLR